MVEILEPYHGKIYDPACGSGGMVFVRGVLAGCDDVLGGSLVTQFHGQHGADVEAGGVLAAGVGRIVDVFAGQGLDL